MREISLITGQLHRAIYNLNDEARRTANQKFESGLPSAPERSLKKAFDQFRDSLNEGDSQVRQRTASLLVTLIRSFEQIPPALQPDVLEMIETGLADEHPLVREATVESYSLLLEKIDDDSSNSEPSSKAPDVDGAAIGALDRLLGIAIEDPEEVVREAAVVGVAVQKSEAVQDAGVAFLLNHVQNPRYRFACRSIASLAEFPSRQTQYLQTLSSLLNDSDPRFRKASLLAALRLAKLETLPRELLPNVTRRLFDSETSVATAAEEVVQAALVAIARADSSVAEFLNECIWLAKQDEPRKHLPAIIETDLVRENLDDCKKLCSNRAAWLRTKRSSDSLVEAEGEPGLDGFIELVDDLVKLDGRSSLGWLASALVRSSLA